MDRKCDGNDKAVKIMWKKFEDMHPKEMRPDWLEKCITVSGNRNQNRNWVIKMILLPKIQLKPDQHWEWGDDGLPLLVRVNSITGERFIVIGGGSAVDAETIFEVEVDFINDLVTVPVNMDLDMLDSNNYQQYRR